MAITKVSEHWYKGTYIEFRWNGTSESGKTSLWSVLGDPTLGTVLGVVKWHGAWRKYAFFPTERTLYEDVCLREIAEFIETLNKERRR